MEREATSVRVIVIVTHHHLLFILEKGSTKVPRIPLIQGFSIPSVELASTFAQSPDRTSCHWKHEKLGTT